MFPVLFRIPNPFGEEAFPIRMFGLMVILGFLCGAWVIGRRLKQRGIMEKADSFDFCFYLLAVGIAGSRLMYVLQNFGQFEGKVLDIFKIWEGGLVWYGGFALSTLFAFWWLGKRKLPVLEVTDACALGLAIGLAVGRIGCLLAGDDYGALLLAEDGTPLQMAEHVPWYGIQVPQVDPANWRTTFTETPAGFRFPYWLHPVQIYMSLGNLAVFAGLWVISRKAKRIGVLTACYFLLYPVQRFVVEFWRGDVDRGVDVLGTGLSFSQAFGIPLVLVGVMMLRWIKTRPVPTAQAVAAQPQPKPPA